MTKAPESAEQKGPGSAEQKSKDAFFQRIAALADEMIAAHGKDFTMGALILGARWIAEGKAGTPAATAKLHS